MGFFGRSKAKAGAGAGSSSMETARRMLWEAAAAFGEHAAREALDTFGTKGASVMVDAAKAIRSGAIVWKSGGLFSKGGWKKSTRWTTVATKLGLGVAILAGLK